MKDLRFYFAQQVYIYERAAPAACSPRPRVRRSVKIPAQGLFQSFSAKAGRSIHGIGASRGIVG